MNTPSSVESLVQEAGRMANAGRWQEAEMLWREVRRLQPNHPQALFSLGFHALQRGELSTADELLRAARSTAPRDPVVLLTLAAAATARGDAAAAREAIDAVLVLDPYFLPGLLAKAGWFERFGSPVAAANAYANALKVAPPPRQWPEALRGQLEHARGVVNRHRQAYGAYLNDALAPLQATLAPQLAGRWREAISIMAGQSRPFHSESNQLHVPRLPEHQFFERELFPWIAALEAKTDVIRAELLAALEQDRGRFTPYIAYNPGEPVNQWAELNHSLRWSTLALWRGGDPVAENIARCPETARALAAVEMADIGGLCPNAMFSALSPKTHIPPHNGETNARLVAHLPLIVPDGCTMRVGFEQRPWRVGEVFVFDDTIEHEARNDSDELRVVLIFDVWNPLLAPAERDLVRAMASAARTFGSAGGADPGRGGG
jgi:aspartyl/asparaginyl beta-hydroxylase (cupin superfamily)